MNQREKPEREKTVNRVRKPAGRIRDLAELANLRPEELTALKVRGIFEQAGYKKYRMSRFEAYELYSENRDFLGDEKLISFTDLDGRLLALKPDVTLSIIKNSRATRQEPEKLYYAENVYRECRESHTFKEISQMGLECIGTVDAAGLAEVLGLAAETLAAASPSWLLEISQMDFVLALLENLHLKGGDKLKMIRQIRSRSRDGILETGRRAGLTPEETEKICLLPELRGPVRETVRRAEALVSDPAMKESLERLLAVFEKLEDSFRDQIRVDFSAVNDIDYYNGLVFQGYLEGCPRSVLSGGQYDRAMARFGKDVDAVGFALYLNELGRVRQETGEDEDESRRWLTIALPKGRLGSRAFGLLAEAGFAEGSFSEETRKLVLENPDLNIRFLMVKPADVAIYVEHQAADAGIVGKDILLETGPDVYELLDLKIGKCRMAAAAPRSFRDHPDRVLRVATKYVNTAKKYYTAMNRDIEIIKLNGSIELAPLLGLSDVIVDIVESGKTLKENDLIVLEEFKQISARLIANKSSFRFKSAVMDRLVRRLSETVRRKETEKGTEKEQEKRTAANNADNAEKTDRSAT